MQIIFSRTGFHYHFIIFILAYSFSYHTTSAESTIKIDRAKKTESESLNRHRVNNNNFPGARVDRDSDFPNANADTLNFQDFKTLVPVRKSRQDEDENESEDSSGSDNSPTAASGASNQNQTSAFEMFFLQVLPAVNVFFRGITDKIIQGPVKDAEQLANRILNKNPPSAVTPILEDPPQRIIRKTSPIPFFYTSTTTTTVPPPDIDLGAFTTTTATTQQQQQLIRFASISPTPSKKPNYYNPPKINENLARLKNQLSLSLASYEDYDEKESSQFLQSFPKLTTSTVPRTTTTTTTTKKPIENGNGDDEILIDEDILTNTIEPSKLESFISKYQYKIQG